MSFPDISSKSVRSQAIICLEREKGINEDLHQQMSVVYCGGAENPPDAGARNTPEAVLENPGVISNNSQSTHDRVRI
jgi:hypothetical protein